jgi:hypothetical protein
MAPMCRCEVPLAMTMKSAMVLLPARSMTTSSCALSSSRDDVTRVSRSSAAAVGCACAGMFVLSRYGLVYAFTLSMLTTLFPPAAGTDRRCRQGVWTNVQENPTGRHPIHELPCLVLRHARHREKASRFRRKRSRRIGRPRKNRNGHQAKDLLPLLPPADLNEIISPHQPDESLARETPPQRSYRVNGVGRAKPAFEVGHTDAAVVGNLLSGRQTAR